MAVDIQRVVLAAVEAALGDDNKPLKKRKGLSAGKAVAVGAVLVTAGRVAAKPGGRLVKEKLRERLGDGSEPEDDEYDEAEAEFEEDEQPEAEEDEQPEAEFEEDEEPEAEFEEDEEPEAEFEEDEEPEAEEDESERGRGA